MTPDNFLPVQSRPVPSSTVTNFDWSVGGTTRGETGGREYELSVFRHWYLYAAKPTWFGAYRGDRFLSRAGLWISSHCDGKQVGFRAQHAHVDGLKVIRAKNDEASKDAGAFLLANGYLKPYLTSPDMRARRLQDHWKLGIRCACCGKTMAETSRKISNRRWELMFPKGKACGMNSSLANRKARKEITCC